MPRFAGVSPTPMQAFPTPTEGAPVRSPMRREVAAPPGTPGLLALLGGGEFQPGNEPHDEVLAASARARGPAYVIATAAARSHPELAVRHASAWFQRFDLDVTELRVYTRTQARVLAT